MLGRKELTKRINEMTERELQDCVFTNVGYVDKDENDIQFKLPDNSIYSLSHFDYYCNEHLGLNEDIKVPISTPEKEVISNLIELEELQKELSESIANEINMIQEYLNERINILKKKKVYQYAVNAQLAHLKEAESVLKFNITDKVIENKNEWTVTDDKSYIIENEIFWFKYKVKKHWSYRDDTPKVDISYCLYVRFMDKSYIIADVEAVKLASEAKSYIEKLKLRFAKYFKYEKPTIDEKTIEKLTQNSNFDFTYEELKNRFISMGCNVVKKL